MNSKSEGRFFRFGAFEADRETGELRKQGRRLPLQGQPLQILLILLARPGDLVTRGELQQRLWPDGTFVDFDHGLNTAINKIRDVLGDSAANPRFVETLARRGYRFIAPVEVVDGNRGTGQPEPPGTPKAAAGSDGSRPEPSSRQGQSAPYFAESLLTSADQVPRASPRLVRFLFLLLQAMYLCFYGVSLARLNFADEIFRSLVAHPFWMVMLLVVTAVVGIPTRLYLICAVAFKAPGLREKFLQIFPVVFALDLLWALAPFLLTRQIGYGLALGATAVLLYVPFAERSLILMGAGSARAT